MLVITTIIIRLIAPMAAFGQKLLPLRCIFGRVAQRVLSSSGPIQGAVTGPLKVLRHGK